MGIKDFYVYDISDEYDSIRRDTWWRRNMKRGIFTLYPPELLDDNVVEIGGDGVGLLEDGGVAIQDVDGFMNVEMEELGGDDDIEEIGGEQGDTGGEDAGGEDEDIGVLTEMDLCDFEEIDDEDLTSVSDADTDADEKAHIIISKMPTQCLILENFSHKVDDHLEDSPIREEEWRSILFQVIAILAEAQRRFAFTHNDLHTNNLM